MKRAAWQTGVSLLELMMVLAILGVVASLALPSYKNFVIQQRISSYTTTLHGALNYSRSEAIARGMHVTICRSENAEAALPLCASANSNPLSNTGWASGWLIFVDRDKNGAYDTAQGDVLLRVQGKLIAQQSAGSIIPAPQRKYITFNPTGQTFGSFMRFAVNRPDDDANVSNERFICIASGGRVRVSREICVN